jgi:allophanate hydrolase subunit 1
MKAGSGAGLTVAPLGDGAVLLTVAGALYPDANALARRVALDIRGRGLAWVTDVIPALVTVAVCFDARTALEASERRATLERMLLEALRRGPESGADALARMVEIPVCYEPAFAPDLTKWRGGPARPPASSLHARRRIGC